MTSEGGCGARARPRRPGRRPARTTPVYVLGGTTDTSARRTSTRRRGTSAAATRRSPTGYGRAARRARTCSRTAGLGPDDVDVCEFYDPFSFEIIRQFEAFGFCGEGEGGDFVMDGTIEPGGRLPVTTDGGHDVVQPRRHRGPAAPAGDPRRRSSCAATCPTMQVRTRRSRCAPAAAPARCSPTCCSSVGSARDRARGRAAAPTGRHPGATTVARVAAVLGRHGSARAALPAVRRLRHHRAAAGPGVRLVHRALAVVGPVCGTREPLLLDGRAPPAAPVLRRSLRAGDRRARRGVLAGQLDHRLPSRCAHRRSAPPRRVPPRERRDHAPATSARPETFRSTTKCWSDRCAPGIRTQNLRTRVANDGSSEVPRCVRTIPGPREFPSGCCVRENGSVQSEGPSACSTWRPPGVPWNAGRRRDGVR